MKSFYFLSLILCSCSMLTIPHYNELTESERSHYKIEQIKTEHHDNQPSGIYSITPEDFNELVMANKFTLVILHKLFCVGSEFTINALLENFKHIDIMIIGGDDQITINYYKEILEQYPNLKKIYMLDNETYGNINSWHENGTVNKRLSTFWQDIQPKKIDSLNGDYPTISLFEGGRLIYAQQYFACLDENCGSEIDLLLGKINPIINK